MLAWCMKLACDCDRRAEFCLARNRVVFRLPKHTNISQPAEHGLKCARLQPDLPAWVKYSFVQ
jgi:hypothetical protein